MLSALRLCVWRFDNCYMELLNINQTLSFTLRAKEWKIFENGILSNFITGFIPTNGATDKVCFLHIFTLYPICFFISHIFFITHISKTITETLYIKNKNILFFPSIHQSFRFRQYFHFSTLKCCRNVAIRLRLTYASQQCVSILLSL